MNPKKFQNVFPLGSHLCRWPMPSMTEMKQDMENLKKHGFNFIKLQQHWAIDESLDGHYDFSKYQELIKYAAKLDMGVYIGLTCEQAPGWLYRKYPDCRMAGKNGVPVFYEAQATLPGDGKPGPCFDHPGAMADMIRYIKKLVETLGSCENIVLWNTWQEIGYLAEGVVGQSVCYCDNTLKFFGEWLKEVYKDIDTLNKTWNTRYPDWNYVAPDRGIKKVCIPQNIAFQYFMNNVQIARVLKCRAEAIRQADVLKRPVFAHKSASPLIGSGMDWTYSRCQDFLGSSCYPASAWGVKDEWWDDEFPGQGNRFEKFTALKNEIWNGVALPFDHIRSCNRSEAPVFAAEFQGGPVSKVFHKGRIPSADDMRRWMLTAIGSGVSGISFWVTRAEISADEMNGFSLLDSEGDTTERFEEVARIGKALNRYPDIFAQPTFPGSKAAILVNEGNYDVFSLLVDVGVNVVGKHLVYSTRGWHRLLWESGIPVDFVEVSELERDYINSYKVLIMPFPLSISEKVAEKLALYVEKGGNLIGECCPGRLNENGYCNRGELSPKAAELFGVKHKNLVMVREPRNGKRWSFPERTYGEYADETMLFGCGVLAGYKLRANFYIETFICNGSKPCLMNKEMIAGTVKRIRKGTAWLFGSVIGHSGTAYRNEETVKLIRYLLDAHGVFPEHNGRLLLRKRVTDKKEAWIFTNPTNKDITERINVNGFKEGEDIFGEKPKREGNYINLPVKSLDVRILIMKK